MAEENQSKEQQKAPAKQAKSTAAPEPQPALKSRKGEPELAYAGENKAVVNPDLNAASVSIPTGSNDEGVAQADTFYLGKNYYVNDDALKQTNAHKVNLLVAAE
jgi:hypothetical protein